MFEANECSCFEFNSFFPSLAPDLLSSLYNSTLSLKEIA